MAFSDWFLKPSKKQLIIQVILWVAGSVFLLLATTDGFKQPLFQRKHLMIFFLILITFGTLMSVAGNYFRNRRSH